MKSSKALNPHTVPHTSMAMAKPPSPSHFLYVPAGSMASRRDIEQSSYCTTPALSQGERTPPCGQATYHPEDELSLDDALRERLLKDKTHGGLEHVVLLEPNERKENTTTMKEINVEQVGISAKDRADTINARASSSSSPGHSQRETEAGGKEQPDTDTDTNAKAHFKGSIVQSASIDIISIPPDQNAR
ncbi:hypothetical protein Plec18170_002059 [Paecilomyces lecythidis]